MRNSRSQDNPAPKIRPLLNCRMNLCQLVNVNTYCPETELILPPPNVVLDHVRLTCNEVALMLLIAITAPSSRVNDVAVASVNDQVPLAGQTTLPETVVKPVFVNFKDIPAKAAVLSTPSVCTVCIFHVLEVSSWVFFSTDVGGAALVLLQPSNSSRQTTMKKPIRMLMAVILPLKPISFFIVSMVFIVVSIYCLANLP